jgi:competence protein ComEC
MAIRKQVVTALILLAGIILSLSGCRYLYSPDEETKRNNELQVLVHFIDVGQGDAILIQLPSRNILIDGGSRNSNVSNYLRDQGVSKLDLIIATHPHEDHIGGLIRILETFAAEEVIDPGYVHTSQTYHQYIAALSENQTKFTVGSSGMIREFGDSIYLRIIHPDVLNSRAY